MSEIQAASGPITTSYSTSQTPEKQQPQAAPPPVASSQAIHISAESAYLFEIDKYLTHLDKAEQNKALEFLSQSKDLLQNKAADYFKQNQETLDRILGGRPPVLMGEFPPEEAENLLNTGLVIDGTTEIAVRPAGVSVFRLDGDSNFSTVQFGDFNLKLKAELDSLEETAGGVLGNQDRANLFGSVSNALVYSENVLLSFDDALHFNYALEKAEAAIKFVDAPEELKSLLTDILNRGIASQDDKQNYAMSEAKKFVNSRVGGFASENLRLGTAAQEYNHKLQSALENTKSSILDSQGLLKKMLTENTDLIRFSPSKLDEAMAFYKSDYEKFERALNKDFSVPAVDKAPDLELSMLEIGSKHALKVIEEIQNYVSNNS